jgi:hypothetical protein
MSKGGDVDTTELRDTVNQLVEAQLDQETTQARLDRFKESNHPPRAPSEFNSLQAFLDFHDRKQLYEGEISSLETGRAAAKDRYDQAVSKLKRVMPTNVPLHYTYEGQRQELEGVRYTIVNRGLGGGASQIVVSAVRT